MAGRDVKNNKDIQREEERESSLERKKTDSPKQKAGGLETLASLHRALQSGQRIAAPAEETLKAAGTLGNQNVLKLIEAGESRAGELAQARANIEAYNFTAALIGPQTDSASSAVGFNFPGDG